MGLNQAVYVEVDGVPTDTDDPIDGYELEIAYCSLAAGTQVVAEPQCASQSAALTSVPYQYQYGAVTSSSTILSIPTFYDPEIPGASPIVSQTTDQFEGVGNPTGASTNGSFFCDNGSNPCGVEIMVIPEKYVIGPGYPPNSGYSAVGNTVIFPLTFSQGGNGCGSAPVMQVDASYSVAQFIPAAGLATCNGPGGVAALATELPSADDSGCATGGGTHCPISDVIDGNVPVTFTDDPEDPATLAEEKQAGGNFAYIPIALSGTEIAFEGGAGVSIQGNATDFALDSYRLTPAMAAGIMTQQWTTTTAGLGAPNDDVCAQLSGTAKCKEKTQVGSTGPILVESAQGKTDNLDVSQALSTTPVTESFPRNLYQGTFGDGTGQTIGGATNHSGATGFALLNPWLFSFQGQTVSEFALGTMWPSTASGASYESTQWMCDAPNSDYTVDLPWGGESRVHDFLSGQQLLANAEQDPVADAKNTQGLPPNVVDEVVPAAADKCQASSSLPIDLASQNSVTQGLYEPSSEPLTAAHAIEGAVARYGANGGFAFSAMDSSEADFFGLLPASLENATGSFVAPSASSLEAAVNDATVNSDGTITPNWNDTGDSDAYPMPMVTYALVSTTQPSATQATELKDLLTNLVNYSYNDGTSSDPLPTGYAPLPSSLHTAALADISNDISGSGGSGSDSGSGSGSGSGSANGSSGSTAGTSAASTPGGSSGVPGARGGSVRGGTGRGAAGTAASSSTGPTPAGSSGGGSSPEAFGAHLITVTVGDNRFFVPGLLFLALLCLIAGPLLYLSPDLRKRVRLGGTDEGPEAAASGPGPPEGD